ncbi:hypothetical protein SKAU_G00290320 [Synaphobranchus kaupii]|uniref:Uncharacterized protein n=1 Tax=Synaphobranchus kaupii TaxID=118154 RepID=A0A9Q1ETT4_SYNKA|nr:hypothetical protein SKAU_G00290320 [Synaphobranchus kaupii]
MQTQVIAAYSSSRDTRSRFNAVKYRTKKDADVVKSAKKANKTGPFRDLMRSRSLRVLNSCLSQGWDICRVALGINAETDRLLGPGERHGYRRAISTPTERLGRFKCFRHNGFDSSQTRGNKAAL